MVLSIIRCVVFVYIHRPISRLTALPSVAAMLPKAKRAASTYVEAALLARLPSASGRGVYADFGAYIIPRRILINLLKITELQDNSKIYG